MIAPVAIIASILTVIGGIVVGIEVSKYETLNGFQPETHHHGGVIVLSIAISVFQAALWLALGAGLKLLADVAKSVGPRDAICPSCREYMHPDATTCPHCQRTFAAPHPDSESGPAPELGGLSATA